jgi:hypothetical protein
MYPIAHEKSASLEGLLHQSFVLPSSISVKRLYVCTEVLLELSPRLVVFDINLSVRSCANFKRKWFRRKLDPRKTDPLTRQR